ncbi:transposase [Beauveria brongniartii RCEF 3172]|uniref:Transposase n=1 Tax=Beauveria brongniartii RCEF 3172 TaxID=1081107 RepID=A0A166W0D2_9HYPO|nr:transposase [Beauveria brongniartii RCEF 3172]
MPRYSETNLQYAIQDVMGGISVRKAAERWAVPRSTIRARINGTAPRKETFEPLQRLSAAQESHLVSWILIQDAIGNAPTHDQVRKIASRLCHLNGDNYDLGKSWLQGFLNHNSEIKTLRGKRLDFERLNGASTYSIQNFFKLLTIKQINEILPQNRYNMDETGLAIGLRENGLVLGSSQKRIALRRQSDQRF